MALLLGIVAVCSTGIGGFVALRSTDRLHLVLGFSAGVLLGLVAFDLLPELFALDTTRVAGVPAAMLTLAAGFLTLHIAERGAAMHGAHEAEYGSHHHPGVGVVAAGALATHSFLDGVGIGLAFQISNSIGLAVAIAVIAHDFADGLNTVSVMRASGNDLPRARLMLALDAFAPLLGVLSTLVIHPPDEALGLYLGFFAGFLLYLSTADILPEAHSHHPSRLTLLSTVGGVGFIFAVVGLS